MLSDWIRITIGETRNFVTGRRQAKCNLARIDHAQIHQELALAGLEMEHQGVKKVKGIKGVWNSENMPLTGSKT